MKAKAFLSGVMIGTALAAVATLLTTPSSGRELKMRCKNNASKFRAGVQQFSQDSNALARQLKTTTQVSKETIKIVGTEVKESVDHWKRDVEPTLAQLKEDIDSLQKNVEQAKQLSS